MSVITPVCVLKQSVLRAVPSPPCSGPGGAASGPGQPPPAQGSHRALLTLGAGTYTDCVTIQKPGVAGVAKPTPNYHLLVISVKPNHSLPRLRLAPNTTFPSSLGQRMGLDRWYSAVRERWAGAGTAGCNRNCPKWETFFCSLPLKPISHLNTIPSLKGIGT